jgi:hypothetical protein
VFACVCGNKNHKLLPSFSSIIIWGKKFVNVREKREKKLGIVFNVEKLSTLPRAWKKKYLGNMIMLEVY